MQKKKKGDFMKNILFVILIVSIQTIFAQSDFEKFKASQQTQEQSFNKAEENAIANYYSQQDSLFIQYKDDIEKLWNEFKESTPKEWVSYNSDFSGRSKVDFAKSKIEVAAVVAKATNPAEKKKQEIKAIKIVKKQLKAMIKQKDGLTGTPILANQIKNPFPNIGKKITPKNIEQVAEQIVKKAKVETIKTKNGKVNEKYVISLDMMPNNVQERIKKYKPYIEKYCKLYNVDPKYAMAIIHTESYYNPKAYNRHGNAYGMMQIVPKYAGKTMNNYLFKKNKLPSSKQLFNPETNLQMGIGYMNWLALNKWSKVTNETNRYYCIVCSYNGGPGTIYKAMTGKMRKIGQKKWDKMMDDLNNWDSEKLYKHLRKKVPFEETRNYIKTVRSRIEKYYMNI